MSDFKSVAGIGGTVRGRATAELRDRILTGRLAPATRLDLDRLSAEFGISRTPVREALLELSYEGLVEIAPRSGIKVIGISPRDAVDNFGVLAVLAGKAAQWATERITDEQLAELQALADAVPGSEDLVAANRAFHRALNRAAGSPRLLTYLRQATRVVPASYFRLFPEQAKRSAIEHAELLEAMHAHNGGQARFVAEAHVMAAGSALGDWLTANAPAADPVDTA